MVRVRILEMGDCNTDWGVRMDDLISRKALIDYLTRPTGFRTNCEDWCATNCLSCIIEEAIKKAPAVEAEPVRHGRWKYYKKQGIAVCTSCSFERKLDDNFGKAISCPNCGTKMGA